jgi:oxygen-independent coproporphyrinogen-3 oxidase
MNRAHTSTQADYAVKCAQDRGFDNITIDLIYSVPGLSAQAWQHNIEKALDLEVQHISAYSLTIEPKTVLGNQLAKGELHPAPDEVSEEQFRVLRQMLLRAGFEHYEVSNFCRPGMQSRHNSSYWKGAHYLGVGPSAHSFNGSSRQWNVANNAKYISGITNGNPNFEIEQLSETMRFNEYLMTGLRTQWGIDLSHIQQEFGIDLRQREQTQLMSFLQQGLLIEEENHIRLTESGLLRADRISSDLFIVES